MTSNVELVVPDQPDMARVRKYLGVVSGVKVGTEPSSRPARRILLVWLSTLDAPDGRQRLGRFFSETWRTTKDAPAVFLSFGSGAGKTTASLQALAVFSSWVGRRNVDPYVAADSAALRRLVLARKANAEAHLIASASLEGDRLVTWSCEPRRFEVAISDIPSLANMDARALQDFEVSSSGSRIHWHAGDVDLDLDTIRACGDPEVRRMHEAARREAAARYADAMRRLRIDKGLTQAGIAGLSERQVRRLEEGSTIPHSATLAKLAAAHGMSMDEYLAELAGRSRAGRRRGKRGGNGA